MKLAPARYNRPLCSFSDARTREAVLQVRDTYYRQTDSFNWDTTPHPPRLYFKPAPPLRHPCHNDLLGLHRLIAGMEMYYASPAESRLPVAPLVKCGESCS